jgi:hypothetical protein
LRLGPSLSAPYENDDQPVGETGKYDRGGP